MSGIRMAAWMAAVPLLAACASGEATEWAGTVTDSAGVQVVANPAEGMWGPGEAWTLVEELHIGDVEAAPEYQFGQVIGVDVDAAANVYVADAQARDVRVFDASGAYLRTIGGPGGGPGEFGIAMNGVFVVGDELVVPDIGNARVQRFALDGSFIASSLLDLTAGMPLRWDMAGGGRLVVQRRVVNPSDTASAPRKDPIVTAGLGDTPVDTLALLPAGETIRFSGGRAQVRFFDPEPIWDADATGTLVTSRNNAMRFELWDATGALSRVVTLPREPKTVTDRDKRVMLDAIRDAMRQQGVPGTQAQALLDQAQFADHYPLYVQVALGPSGSLWVQRMLSGTELAGEEGSFDAQDLGSKDWDVFDASGRYLGVVSFPGKFLPLRTLGDRFYGYARDELDVQSLRVYRVVGG